MRRSITVLHQIDRDLDLLGEKMACHSSKIVFYYYYYCFYYFLLTPFSRRFQLWAFRVVPSTVSSNSFRYISTGDSSSYHLLNTPCTRSSNWKKSSFLYYNDRHYPIALLARQPQSGNTGSSKSSSNKKKKKEKKKNDSNNNQIIASQQKEEEEGISVSSTNNSSVRPIVQPTVDTQRMDRNRVMEDEEEEQEWLSDRELLRRAAQSPGGEALTNRNRDTLEPFQYAGGVDEPTTYRLTSEEDDDATKETKKKKKKSVYTEEERELIQAMGGSLWDDHHPPSSSSNANSREEGYLGDCTLMEISHDYAVPVCYLADVLMTWGVPPPISVDSTLGDLVTGEQAFALIEALTTLDNTQINERYSYDDLITLCEDYDLDLRLVFNFCIHEGYNLPFGVRTCLRIEQEKELLRVMCAE